MPKKSRLFFKIFFNLFISKIPSICFRKLLNFPDSSNIPDLANKKADISFSTGIIQKISAFDSLLKIGFLFFLFSALSRRDKTRFENIFYSTEKFFVKSQFFFALTFLVIHNYFPAHPNISLNAPPRRSNMETFGAPV
jgi:hypothetical protein